MKILCIDRYILSLQVYRDVGEVAIFSFHIHPGLRVID